MKPVAIEQRRRIVAAVPLALAPSGGFEGLSVERMIAVAGVSRRTFYELFANRADAFRTACDEAFATLHEIAIAAAEGSGSWSERVGAVLRSALGLAANHPQVASMVVIDTLCASPELRRHHLRSLDRFVPLLREGRGERSGERELPATLEPTLLDAVCHSVGARLHRGAADSLPALAPELTRLLLAPYA